MRTNWSDFSLTSSFHSINYHCDVCKLSFETETKLANHKYNTHIDLVTVTLDDGKRSPWFVTSLLLRNDNALWWRECSTEYAFSASVSRADGKFICLKCSSKLNSPPTTLNRHLGKMHNGRCSTSSIRKKRLHSEVDHNDNSIVDANDNNNSNDNSRSMILRQYQM